jgi:antitoxin (DNA-binding transcriptional repressor) of toxin-antitoxin stability system
MIYNMTMIKINIYEAKMHLSRYLARLHKGEVILLCKRNVPVAEIRAVAPSRTRKRPIGLAKKELVIPEAFFEPLPDEVIKGFLGESG